MTSKKEIGDLLTLVASEIQDQLDVIYEARKRGRYKRTSHALYRVQQSVNDLRALSKEARGK